MSSLGLQDRFGAEAVEAFALAAGLGDVDEDADELALLGQAVGDLVAGEVVVGVVDGLLDRGPSRRRRVSRTARGR